MTQPGIAPPVATANDGKGPGTLSSIIVAVIAIIGTVAGGAITGYYSYATTSHNTDTQRSSQLEDQRRATYAAFLDSATAVCIALQTQVTAPAVQLISDMTDKESSVFLISPSRMQAPTEQLDDYLNTQANTKNGTCDGDRFRWVSPPSVERSS